MKFALVLLASSFISGFATAGDVEAPEYYSAEFKVESISALCPRVSNRPTCMAIGSRAVVKAIIGCADTLAFSEETVVENGSHTDIHIVSVVKKNPKSAVIRCIKPNTIEKSIVLRGFARTVEVVNTKIVND